MSKNVKLILVSTTIFLALGLISSVYASAMDVDSVTVTVHFPLIQNLSVSASSDNVAVEQKSDHQVTTRLALGGLKSTQDLQLPEAIEVDILSTVDWHLIAKVENTYVRSERTSTRISGLELKVSGQPNFEDVHAKTLELKPGQEGELASGSPTSGTSFSVGYQVKLSTSSLSDVSGVGGEIVYTLMQL